MEELANVCSLAYVFQERGICATTRREQSSAGIHHATNSVMTAAFQVPSLPPRQLSQVFTH